MLVPLGIFIVSVIGIAWLVGRKFVYLKKLSPEIVESSAVNGTDSGFWEGFSPGLSAKIGVGKIQKYKFSFLSEFEKFLRKFRLVSLKIDTLINGLIQRIRDSLVKQERVAAGVDDIQGELEIRPAQSVADKTRVLKEEEQKLIIEIAKTPGNPELYKELGKIYSKTGEIDDAVESFTKAVELDPGDDEIRVRLERAKKKLEKVPT